MWLYHTHTNGGQILGENFFFKKVFTYTVPTPIQHKNSYRTRPAITILTTPFFFINKKKTLHSQSPQYIQHRRPQPLPFQNKTKPPISLLHETHKTWNHLPFSSSLSHHYYRPSRPNKPSSSPPLLSTTSATDNSLFVIAHSLSLASLSQSLSSNPHNQTKRTLAF